MRPRSKDDRRAIIPDMCKRFPLAKNRVRFPRHRGRYGSDRNSPSALGRNGNKERRREELSANHSPQADRLSRFLALIWAMSMGPSENSPSPAFRVNSRK